MYRHNPVSQNKQADIENHFAFAVCRLYEDLHWIIDACVQLKLVYVFISTSQCKATYTEVDNGDSYISQDEGDVKWSLLKYKNVYPNIPYLLHLALLR